MSRAAKKLPWRSISVTMLTGWGGRLREAAKLIAAPLDAIADDGLRTQALFITQRTADELEDELRAQLQFEGWMNVEEEETT